MDCAAFLAWAAPLLGLRAEGFTNVRRQVCRRLAGRMRELGMSEAAYRRLVIESADERRILDELCFVTISRFYRDHIVWDALSDGLLEELACDARMRGANELRAWSAGCASGEEPYTLAMLWKLRVSSRVPGMTLDVVATDRSRDVLRRASEGIYERGSLSELPEGWIAAFDTNDAGDRHHLRSDFREGVRFEQRDVREWAPEAPLDIVLCRNVVFTYFDRATQEAFLARVTPRLVPGGLLLIGPRERAPIEEDDVAPALERVLAGVYRKPR